ncbi:hypothetical protein BLS_005573 [Venturia inaequalis]|uniref:Imidazoleglycerol-phosphate dehydratase n=1 Tax=Venturia inaequalis TaxID=5025 RepID=A0A8H3V793_VENIN|nr:hypothetical protein BLS_005573 [Venturia inaequalis]
MSERKRTATINRDTNETKVNLILNLDGGPLEEANGEKNVDEAHATQVSKSQTIDVDSGIGFLDHMLHALAKHAGWSLKLKCKGDLHIDDHHTAEDVCLALGTAFKTSLGTSTGLTRFGSAYCPLDEALSRADRLSTLIGLFLKAGGFEALNEQIPKDCNEAADFEELKGTSQSPPGH